MMSTTYWADIMPTRKILQKHQNLHMREFFMTNRLTANTAVLNTATAELNKYLERMSIFNTSYSFTLRVDASLPSDELHISVCNDKVTLAGGNGRGVLYAVYRFLEHLGCRFYAEDTEVVPSLTGEALAALLPNGLEIKEASPLEFRDLYWGNTYRPDFAVKLRLNAGRAGSGTHPRDIPTEWGDCIGYAGPHFVHTFEKLIPAEEFFETHPEYFSMINGERTAKHLYSQICLSNPDVFHIVVDRVKGWLRENPRAKIVSVSQNDSFVIESYCTCPACAAVDAEEGSPAGSLVRFVNAVAEAIEPEFPDVAIDTLAYAYSTTPPKITKPRHNVMVRLCTGYCISHPIEECERNKTIKECMETWATMCDRLYVWDYTTDFLQYLAPCPNLESLMPNIRFFVKNHTKGLFEQGNYNGGKSGEFDDLRAFILAKGMWDPYTEPDTDGFLEAFYGGGAPYVKKYLDYIHAKTRDLDVSPVYACSNLWNPLISDEDMAELDAWWKDAYEAALNGGTTAGGFGISAQLAAEHVERSALCHRWFKLDCKRGEFADDTTFDTLAEAFYKDCKRLGVERISEGANVPWIDK